MKIYKRMIRPIVSPPGLETIYTIPLINENNWVDEEFEDVLRPRWEEWAKKKSKWSSLHLDEKYVEIELPEAKPIKIVDENLILFVCDFNDIENIDLIYEYLECFQKILPPNVGMALLPKADIRVLSEDEAYVFLEQYKKTLDNLYGKE